MTLIHHMSLYFTSISFSVSSYVHLSRLIIRYNQLYPLLTVQVPLVPDVLPDLVDRDPHHGDTRTHGQEENIVRYFSSVEENVVKGDDEETKTACIGKFNKKCMQQYFLILERKNLPFPKKKLSCQIKV